MKKLITVAWSVTIEADLPDEVGLDELESWNGPHAKLAEEIISQAVDALDADGKTATITDVQEV
jgi:hypothetical protein